MASEFRQKRSSIDQKGHRKKIRIADVRGRFASAKNFVFTALILVYALLPWIKVHGHPAIFIDIFRRKFYLFGLTFNAQDFYLVFFIITGVFFILFFVTALVGRVWCGWACPQTVFLEGVFRKIERWIEGPKSAQILLASRPWGFNRIFRFAAKHFFYLVSALVITHIFLSYFVSLEELFVFIRKNPREHWVAFLWMLGITGAIYINFAWFREQLCLIVCPYGRIQSALIDDDSLVIGYDAARGEPRGKKNDPSRGDCIDCHRCVDVCPTGIDIREGLQMECVGCANCIDACDEIMLKIGQRRGLIRYDSLNGLKGLAKKILRPRVYLYTAFLFLGMAVFSIALAKKNPFEANLLRLQGPPYVLTAESIRNQFFIHLSNKTPDEAVFKIEVEALPEAARILLPVSKVELESLGDKKLPFFVEMDKNAFHDEFTIRLHVVDLKTHEVVIAEAPFLGPSIREKR